MVGRSRRHLKLHVLENLLAWIAQREGMVGAEEQTVAHSLGWFGIRTIDPLASLQEILG